MRRGMYFSWTVGVAMCLLFFASGCSSDDVAHATLPGNPWAGQWGCAVESSTSEIFVHSVQQLTIDINGAYTGIVTTVLHLAPEDDLILDCTASGTVTEVRDGYATLEGTGECEQFPGLVAESVADCVGMLRGANGFLEMRCIDLTQEPDGRETLLMNICKRQDISS